MTTKHTPGPWTVSDSYLIHDAAMQEIACIHSRDVGVDEREENARLIAAAPDLLAALDELVTRSAVIANRQDASIALDGYVRHKLDSAIADARAALAKAEGKS